MSKRRDLLRLASGLALLALPFPAPHAQQPRRQVSLGILFAGTFASSEKYFRAFFEALAELGYAENRNLRVERRFADGRIDRLDELARELVAARVDIIFAPPTPAVLALKKVTSVIPVVFCLPPDPIGTGLVKSLARPGGNVTGVSTSGSALVPKRIELIRELVPNAQRIGVLSDAREPSAPVNLTAARQSAKSFGGMLIETQAQSRDGISAAFATLQHKQAQALLVFEGSLALTNRDLVLSHAASQRLPVLYAYPEIVAEGGLMSYTANTADQYRRAAHYVDKILKGANAGDLPIEQPRSFELAVNVRTAKGLGLNVPRSLLLRADRVFE